MEPGNTELKMVQVNSDHLKKLQTDPVAQVLDLVNKLTFVHALPPTLQKDMRVVQIETFYRANFNSKQSGLKTEVLKLQNCVREPIKNQAGLLKQVTYETLHQVLEDVLNEHGYYS